MLPKQACEPCYVTRFQCCSSCAAELTSAEALVKNEESSRRMCRGRAITCLIWLILPGLLLFLLAAL